MSDRRVTHLVPGLEVREGAGVVVRCTIGTQGLDHVDPFLLLDEFRPDDSGDYIAGFPDHPHRGFETVTYILAGAMAHADHAGNKGLLGPVNGLAPSRRRRPDGAGHAPPARGSDFRHALEFMAGVGP